ncbi:BppU family phage baseplate upper protein, partial [Clostridium perfringens]|uniref:BppU family phage baseplate upper protein n=1 Tax=Clostridium perfringens TaxID=1502 RepID=UPI0018E46C0B
SLVEPRFIDPLNGIVRFVVDSGFLSAATNTWVKGQARLRAVGRKDTVILNEFSFYVKDALINKIGADIKVRYIRQIDQLIEETQKRVNEAILGISNVESAKVSFDSFISKQKTDLENIITDTESKMKKLADSTQIAVDDQLNRFRSEANAIKVDLQSET